MSTRAKIGIISALTAVGLAIASAFVVSKSNNRGTFTMKNAVDAIDPTTLTEAAAARVFFGHQSVGANVISGISPAFEAHGMSSPRVLEVGPDAGSVSRLPSGGFFAHSFIGKNGDPESKLKAFDSMLRSGIGDQVDVALMKFCYLDVTSSTDVDALFSDYRTTMASLERDFPDVRFIYVTTPLTTAPGTKSRLKSLLSGGDSPVLADNAARERFNALLRASYGPDRLFDLAAFESTTPDGTRLTGTYDGQAYFTLYDGYATDEGHLNALASQVAASELLALVGKQLG